MDLSSLLSELSQDDIEKLKKTAQQFFGGKEETTEKEQVKKKDNSGQNPFDFPFDPKLISSVARFSGMMNENDEKSNFILALKPLLSEKRQKKADDAVMMLKFMKIINAFQENTK